MKYTGSHDYIASEELIVSVNVAMALEKPLLIKGEPGTGKTMLAQSVSEILEKPLIVWNIKSTTKAQEALYHYDTVQRLYDSQFHEGKVEDISRYIRMGKLGEAFLSEEQVVLLIDEIDKADMEFPNDLLWELDRMEFFIPETGERVHAKHRPIVLITSNSEKELPDAFLRRCLFHYIEFPEPELMTRIVLAHFPDLEDRLLKQAVTSFYRLRGLVGLQKKPGTSELLDWIRILAMNGMPPEKIAEKIPFAGLLLKKKEDLDLMAVRGL